jgi:hypothetical protein
MVTSGTKTRRAPQGFSDFLLQLLTIAVFRCSVRLAKVEQSEPNNRRMKKIVRQPRRKPVQTVT